MQDGETIPAKQLEAKEHKVVKASSTVYVELENVTKRYACVPVIQHSLDMFKPIHQRSKLSPVYHQYITNISPIYHQYITNVSPVYQKYFRYFQD